jgi:hypothetical protein
MLHVLALSAAHHTTPACLRFHAAVESPRMLLMPLFLLATAEANVIHDTLDKAAAIAVGMGARGSRELAAFEEGKLQIKAQRGTLWKADRNDAKNLLVRPWPRQGGGGGFRHRRHRPLRAGAGRRAGGRDVLFRRRRLREARARIAGGKALDRHGPRGEGRWQQIDREAAVESDEVTLYLARHGDRNRGAVHHASGTLEKIGDRQLHASGVARAGRAYEISACSRTAVQPAADARVGDVLRSGRDQPSAEEVSVSPALCAAGVCRQPAWGGEADASTRVVASSPPPCGSPLRRSCAYENYRGTTMSDQFT